MRLCFSPQALADLTAILEHVGRDNPRAALQLVNGLEAMCHTLVGMPRAGTIRNDLIPGLRAFSHGNYAIYFLCPTESELRIVRIMHGARDVKAEDFRPER